MIYIQFPQRCQVKKANYRIQIYEWIDEAKSQANVQSKIVYKAITPSVLTVFMAHPSPI